MIPAPVWPIPTPYTDPREWPHLVLGAATVLLEAESEPYEGKLGVAWTLRHRMSRRRQTLPEVCLAPWQYSCWNADYKLQRVSRLTAPPAGPWGDAFTAMTLAYLEIGLDPTHGADHYLNPDLTRQIRPLHDLPDWYRPEKIVARIGRHEFLRLE